MEKAKDETIKLSLRLSKSKIECLMTEYGTTSITEVFNKLIEDKLTHKFNAPATRSVLTSVGAKNRLAKRIIDFMPVHTTYVEPFGNTASVLLKKEKTEKEVYNDVDGNVTNFFMVLRDNPIGLYNACTSLPYSQDMYFNFLNAPIPSDPVERAVKFFYTNRCGFMGNHFKGFKSDGKNRNYSEFYSKECERFYPLSKRFEGVEIVNKDYKKVIKKHLENPNALFFCDPPYLDGTDYYNNSFTKNDWLELADLLSKIKGKAMVCHSQDLVVNKLFTELGFRVEKIRTKYYSAKSFNEDGDAERPASTLCLYLNY